MDWEAWTRIAWEVREHAHAPYSRFAVGAVVVDAEGRAFAGANVENLSFGLTQCAERVAVGSAIAAGARRLVAAVVVADTREPIVPCGACRQVLAEFGDPELHLVGREGHDRLMLSELLPHARRGILTD